MGLFLREQIADETAMSRRAFLQGTGLLLGFCADRCKHGVHLRGACFAGGRKRGHGYFGTEWIYTDQSNRRRDPGHADGRDGTGGLHGALDASG
jgi:hypothetical protein